MFSFNQEKKNVNPDTKTYVIDYFVTGIWVVVIFTIFFRKTFNFFTNKKEAQKPKADPNILVITNTNECREACSSLLEHCQDLWALGFDCEWITLNGQQRPVALLQLATVRGLCCLFRLNILGEIPKELSAILTCPQIIKLGVNPQNDSRLLLKDYGVEVCSTLDLRYLYPTKGMGLASLAASVLEEQLDKSWRVQCSNWESPELSEAQKLYAANDALVAIRMFEKWVMTLSGQKKHVNLNFLLTCFKNDISQYLNLNFNQNTSTSSKSSKKVVPEGLNNTENQNLNSLKCGYITRKRPLYDNCFMHAPDGELLCSCDKKKAQWYLERGLAEVMQKEPYSIRLLFEPSARAGDTNGGRFYQQLKQNCCVVCGALKSYLKHNVVPKEYRRHFPKIMKDHQSHDVVLMCLRCHHVAAQHNEALRQVLARMCNAPIKNAKVSQNGPLQKVKNSAKALLNSGDMIPLARKLLLEDEVKNYYKVNVLTADLLKEAANLESNIVNENYESHGIKVVNYFKHTFGDLTELELLWREYFLDTMDPKHLPALWSTTHNHSRLAALADKNKN